MEPTIVQTDHPNRLPSQTCGRLGAPDFSSTSGIMKNSVYTNKTLSCDQKDMFILFKCMLEEGIKPAMVEQIMTLENKFTLKMETLLRHIMVSMTNTQTSHMERVYDCLQ